MTRESTLKQHKSSKSHMPRKVSKLSSKKRENTFRQVLEVTWHYKTLLSESAINPPPNNYNKAVEVIVASCFVLQTLNVAASLVVASWYLTDSFRQYVYNNTICET